MRQKPHHRQTASGPDMAVVERAVHSVLPDAVVLPATELSGFRGYPIIEWSPLIGQRLRSGIGPMLDRPTLSLWESWPTQVNGFASTATWPHAIWAARELRGFGATFVITATRPSTIKLADADVAGVYVVQILGAATAVLVHGHPGGGKSPRMVATRYWEERLLAHALSVAALQGGIRGTRQGGDVIRDTGFPTDDCFNRPL